MSKKNKYTDSDLLAMLRSKDPAKESVAYKQIYLSNSAMVKSYVGKNSGTADDAVDLFQDVMIVLYNNLKKEDFELQSQLNTYIFSIARNLWYKKLRKLDKTLSIEDASYKIGDKDLNGLEVIEKLEKFEYLNSSISKLGDGCKKVLKSFYYDKRSMKQISEEMNYANEQVARNKKMSCLKKLREISLSKLEQLK